LSGRGLCDELITRPEESYRLCCVVVCDLETSRMGAPYIYDISRLRVNAFYDYFLYPCGLHLVTDLWKEKQIEIEITLFKDTVNIANVIKLSLMF